MVELVSTMENLYILVLCLLMCSILENDSATAHASLYVRSGNSSSQVDFILGSCVHCNLPTGGSVEIYKPFSIFETFTDAPNFLIEVIRNSPTTLIFILDLPPRKDLAQHPNYLKTFYEEMQLDKQRQLLEKLPEKPNLPRPFTLMSPVAKVMLDTWLDLCPCTERRLTDDESTDLAKRDRIIKNKIIDLDLESSFPRLFGQEVANQVLGILRKIYNS